MDQDLHRSTVVRCDADIHVTQFGVPSDSRPRFTTDTSNSGFGPEGEWSRNGSMDAVCQAMSGAAVAQGGGPSHEPVLIENCPADQSGAWNFAFSIVSALFHRERTGRGQWLQTSQL